MWKRFYLSMKILANYREAAEQKIPHAIKMNFLKKKKCHA